ncbi:MAG TPA: DUF1343 domain-containing protein [Candidatus Saccharimonadales bacterium]|nr:DUF1343 domain-containing protein [Candidatus Saccharimonadales bacterium]
MTRQTLFFVRPFFLGIAIVLVLPASASANRAAGKTSKTRARAARVQTGLDVLEAQKFAPLRGKRIGVITNHTGLDAQGRSIVELLARAPGVKLVAIFSPEHGLAGRKDVENIPSSRDSSTGLPVYSLYGETRRPTEEMLQNIDTLVFDVQDAGVRFYTYTATMGYCMEEAAKRKISFYVLDRPNPLGGEVLEGPMLDADKTAFVAYYPVPVRYGLTIGELAQFYNTENHINADLHVIAMKNWHRNYYFESTGIRWLPPSPNLRTLKGSIVYPGIEILQAAKVSVGRGTETPFEQFGAPWMDGEAVARALNERNLPGLRFASQPFIPVAELYSGKRCGGVAIRITDRAAVRSLRLEIEIATILKKLYPQQFDVTKLLVLTGNDETIRQLTEDVAPEKIVASWSADLQAFDKLRRRYFLYK